MHRSRGKRGSLRGARKCGSEGGDGIGLCGRDASGTSGNGAQGVGPSGSEGASASADGVRVEVPVLCGGRTQREAAVELDRLDEV